MKNPEIDNFLLNNPEIKIKGVECFGSLKKLERWLSSSTIYSKGFTNDEDGRVIDMTAGEILAEIGRIEHGVF